MSLAGQIDSLATAVGTRVKTLNTARNLPTYIPTTAKYEFDPQTGAYNWKASNTKKLRASLARAAAATGNARFVFHGASNTEGRTTASTFNRQKGFVSQFRNAMASLGAPLSGDGMILAGNGATSSPYDPRVVLGGTWTGQGTGYAYTSTNGSTLTTTPLYPSKYVDVWYTDNSGPFTVAIDGASSGPAFASVTPAATLSWQKVTLTAPAFGMHTVVLTTTSTTQTSIRGFNFYGDSGLLVHNVGVSGFQTTDYLTFTAWFQATGIIESTLPPATGIDAMFFYDLGANDLINGRSVAQAKADLITLMGRYTVPDRVIFVPPHVSSVAQATWEAYAVACYEVADQLDIPLIDPYYAIGTWTQGNANGMYGDAAHLSTAGSIDQGRMIANIVAKNSHLSIPMVRSVPTGSLDYPNYPDGTVLVEYTP